MGLRLEHIAPVWLRACRRLYGEIAYDDLKVKIGHFYTPIGYEVVQAPQNFFYSHSYSHTYGEPFTHTGFLGDYACSEKVHFYGGWVDGWDEGFAAPGRRLDVSRRRRSELFRQNNLGLVRLRGEPGHRRRLCRRLVGRSLLQLLHLTHKLTDKWTYVLEHDLGTNYNVSPTTGVDNQWYEVDNYLLYKISDCLSCGGRIEWFQDPQGARVIARRSRQLLRHVRRSELEAAR